MSNEYLVSSALEKMRDAIKENPKLTLGQARFDLFPNAPLDFRQSIYEALKSSFEASHHPTARYIAWQQEANNEASLPEVLAVIDATLQAEAAHV